MNPRIQMGPSRARIAGGLRSFRHNASSMIATTIACAAMLGLPAHGATRNVPGTYATIGAAITAAASGDTILVDDGTYSAQNVLTNKVLTIKSVNGPSSTIVNCGGNYFGTYQGNGTLIQGFTFRNGTSSLGVIALQTSATVDNCIFTNNNSGFNFSPACINSAGTGNTVTITNCSFDHNSGLGAVQFNSKVVMSDSTFTSNTGQFGSGAIYANTATGQITRCSFSGNHSDSNDQGGAIYWVNGALTCTDCSFTNNVSGAAGGAIETGAQGLDSPLTLTNCLFTGNSAPKGGAVSDSVSSNLTCSITATNCIFAGNSASSNGAAIDSTGSIVAVSLNVTNCSFYGNAYTGGSPSAQGAISADGSTQVTIKNSILYGDTTSKEISTANTPASLTVTFTDIQQSGFSGSGNINADPLYLAPANANLHIPSTSPAALTGTSSGAPTEDYDGFTRPTPPSMGAFEPSIVPTHFQVTLPASTVSGSALSITVTAVDDNGVTAPAYNGTVAFSSSDAAFVNPGPIALVGGAGSVGTGILNTAGVQTITVTDGSLSGTGSTTVLAGPASALSISVPRNTTAGTPFNIAVTALDAAGNTATGYSGTVHFSSSDGSASLPADTTLTNGVGTFNATLNTIGSQTITATDTVTSSITGTSGAIDVQTGPATHFTVSTPSTATAGVAFNATVTALDSANHTVTGYTGTVHFTTTSSSYNLPADSTLTNGTGTFSVKLNTAGNMTLTAEDAANNGINGTSANIAVSAGAAGFFNVLAPSTAIAGVPFNITVNAFDSFGNAANTYTGPVSFNSGDPLAVLPPNSSLTAGTGTFSVTLNTVGTQSIDSHDVASPGVTGNTGPITVSPAGATHFAITVPSTSVAGSAISFTVTALDAADSVVPNYKGTVHFTSSDPRAVLPANVKLVNGTGTFSATLKTAGADTITATDTVTSSITGTSKADNVTAAAPARFRFYIRSTVATGNPEPFSLQAQDLYGNPTPSYSGTVHFTSTDSAATLPADLTLVGGVGLSSVTFATPGAQTLTATDTLSSGITSGVPVTVTAMPAVAYKITAPASVTKGTPFTVTVTAIDANYHLTPAYSGTVHFTSTDPTASLPADATLTNGVGTFSVTLNKAGRFSINAQDTVTATIKGQAPNVIAH